MTKPSLDEVRERLHYDCETGALTWAKPRCRRISVGDEAGHIRSNGYYRLSFRVDGKDKEFYSHHIAWFWFYGVWPQGIVDHINRDTADNRITNLRVCSPSQSNANTKVRTDSRSGIKGVSWWAERNRWRARLGKKTIGYFNTAEAAAAAYKSAAKTAFGEFAST